MSLVFFAKQIFRDLLLSRIVIEPLIRLYMSRTYLTKSVSEFNISQQKEVPDLMQFLFKSAINICHSFKF